MPAPTSKAVLPSEGARKTTPNSPWNGAAYAYWGGNVRITDAAGKVLAEQRLPQDVTALAWTGDVLIVGDADGRLMRMETGN